MTSITRRLSVRLPVAAAVLAPVLLAACAPSPAYETAPITVQTAAGPVTCQLYRHDMVMWDRSTARPAGMTDADANAACMAEGKRIQTGAADVAVAAPAAVVTVQPTL